MFETVKFICEFFFDDIYHYFGLLLLLMVSTSDRIVKIIRDKKD